TSLYGSPNWLALDIVARLRPEISRQQAQAQLLPAFQTALTSGAPFAGSVNGKDQPPQLMLSSVRGVERLRENYDEPLRFLMSMVALVLLIACANVVVLLLARNSARLPELCLRQALGANRRALFVQLLQESALLVAAGAVLGWIFAGAATQALTAWS